MTSLTASSSSNSLPSVNRRTASASVLFACLAMLVCCLPFSAANGALGAIVQSTGADTAQLQWVTDAFAVVLGATVLSAGVLGDILGRRRIVLLGLALTTVGSGLALSAGFLAGGTLATLWVGQSVSGFGGGLVMSASLALVAASAPSAAYRARVISLRAAAVVVGLGSGPFLAGCVTAALPWQWMYLPIAAAAIAVFVFGALFAAESSAGAGRSFDLPGPLTSALGIAALTFGVISVGTAGWAAPPTIIGLVVGGSSLLAFVVVERRSSSPLLRPALFRSAGFTAAGIAATSVLFTLGGGVFVLSLYLSSTSVDGLGIAVRLGCLFAGNAIASVACGLLQQRIPPKILLATGLLLAAAGAFSLLSIDDSTDLSGFAWRLAILGFGSGLVMATSSSIAVQSVSAELGGMAGAANNAMRQFGAALGPAVLGGILSLQLASGGSALTALHISATVVCAVFLASGVTAVLLLSRRTAHLRLHPSPTGTTESQGVRHDDQQPHHHQHTQP